MDWSGGELEALRKEVFSGIHAQREEILRAFVAKYGCDPDEVTQVFEPHDGFGFRWYVTKTPKDQAPTAHWSEDLETTG